MSLATLAVVQMVAGLIVEGIAWWQGWWFFFVSWWIVAQVVLVWGGLLGWTTWQTQQMAGPFRYLAGVVVGGVGEIANLVVFDLWRFPGREIWGGTLPLPGLLWLALAWGLLPWLAPPLIRWGRSSLLRPGSPSTKN